MLCTGLVIGLFGVYSDQWVQAYWLQIHPPAWQTILVLCAGLMGNAGGLWTLIALFTANWTYRGKSTSVLTHMVAAISLLVAAVLSYYWVIYIAQLRPDASLLPTVSRWLIICLIAGGVAGLASACLSRKNGWAWLFAGGVVASLVGLDCLVLARSHGVSVVTSVVMGIYLALTAAVYWLAVRGKHTS